MSGLLLYFPSDSFSLFGVGSLGYSVDDLSIGLSDLIELRDFASVGMSWLLWFAYGSTEEN